ncbi:MAG TPA: hypothetical protein VIH42_11095 [Thermoguttaceae bacterium]
MRNRIFSSTEASPTASPAYEEGMAAFLAGDSFCPHVRGPDWSQDRYAWWMGYLDARNSKFR